MVHLSLPAAVTLSFPAVTRIVRVISQPRGNMLLVGIGGSGRQSLARLASSICEYYTFQIEVSRQYRKQEFREGERVPGLAPGQEQGCGFTPSG